MRRCLASLVALGTAVVVFAALTVAVALWWGSFFQPDSQNAHLVFVAVLTGISAASFIAGSVAGNWLNRKRDWSARTKRRDWSISSRSVQIGEPGPIWLLRERGFRYEDERHN